MKRLFSLLPLLLLLALSFINSPVASAHTAHTIKPAVDLCGGGCGGSADWLGTHYGAATKVYVPNITMTNTTYYERQLVEFDPSNGDQITVGECFGSGGGACVNNSGNYYTYMCKSGSCGTTYTYTMPAGDKGGTIDFEIVGDMSSGVLQAWDIYIKGGASGADPCTTDDHCWFAKGNSGSMGDMALQNFVLDGSAGWQDEYSYTFNQFESSNASLNFQAVDPSTSAIEGAQMEIWDHPHGATNNGGTIWGCNEDNESLISCGA
jgi:hypothetical protein